MFLAASFKQLASSYKLQAASYKLQAPSLELRASRFKASTHKPATNNRKPETRNRKQLSDSLSFTLPFSRAGNLILIQATVDSISGNFILDTGAPHLVLNLTYFRDYPITEADEERTGATGSVVTAQRTQVTEFTLGAMKYSRVQADLANLGNIENVKGVRILGLIGMELLAPFEMIIDFELQLIHFRRVEKRESKTYLSSLLKNTEAYATIPIDITDNKIMLTTNLGGKKLKLIVDTGAETNMIDSRLPSAIFKDVAITGRTTMSGVGSSKIEVLRGNLKSLTIGGQSFETLPVVIANLEKTCFAYAGCVDGILGFDFLSLRKVGFNFVKRQMYIWK